MGTLAAKDVKLAFGKHKGKVLGSLPDSYLSWIASTVKTDWRRLAQQVLDERNGQVGNAANSADGFEEVEAFAGLLRSCGNAKDLREGKRVHARIFASKYQKNVYLANQLVLMYGKCGILQEARKVFNSVDQPDLFSWNIMTAAYAQNGYTEEAKSMFDRMPQRDIVSWASMIQAFTHVGHLVQARNLFDKMPEWNVVSSTAMVAAYAQKGHALEAKTMFDGMPQQDMVAWTAMLRAYAQNGYFEEAKDMFEKIPSRNVVSWTVMIQAYAQNGDFAEAEKMFQLMPQQDVVSWTTMMAAYAHNGHVTEVQRLFEKIPEVNVFSWTALLAAYAQNGHVKEAKDIFYTMPKPNLVSWNAMIAAYAHNGCCNEAIELFSTMKQQGVEPDDVTFTSIFTACSHEGLLEEGWCYFVSMSSDHGIKPLKEHYWSMIDILGRAGKLADTEDLIDNMPFLPDDVAWGTLLGACKTHRDVDRAERVAEKFIKLDPQNAGPYVLLANIYAVVGRHEDMVRVRRRMTDKGVRKEPGISVIEVESRLHKFMVGDTSHPQNDVIRAELQRLLKMMKEAGYVADTKEVLSDVTEKEKEHLLLHHSEKLAIAFGMIATGPELPLRIVKNLRVCSDCHTAAKFISKVVRRQIFVRDATRFHHFENGRCSCKDYW